MKLRSRTRLSAGLGLLFLAAAGGARAETRIAVWGFSADAGDAEGTSLGERLAALTEVELAGRGCAVVERRGFERILKEHRLGFTQFADPEKAVRAGKLVRADVVLVGTVLERGEGRLVTMKAVETASGKVLDARARALSEWALRKCASYAADFVTAARGKKLGERVFLAVGGFEDLSVNDRFRGLGRELRGALAVAFRDDARISLVEREHVEPLLLELGLSKSGLASADFGETDAVPAFLVVDGLYQSYRTEVTRITLNLRLERLGQRLRVVQLDAAPGPALVRAAADAIREFLAGARIEEPTPVAKKAEAEVHFKRGCEQARITETDSPYPRLGGPLGGYFRADDGYSRCYPKEPKRLENLKNAMSSFGSAILLDPPNYRAKLYLAACLADPDVGEFDRARRLMQEVIAGVSEKRLRGIATVRLGQTYVDAHANLRDRKDEAIRKKLESDFRQAINTWLKFAQTMDACEYKHHILSEAAAALYALRRLGLASAEECVEMNGRQAELNCSLQLRRWERLGNVHVQSFSNYWRGMRALHGVHKKPADRRRAERARAECLALAGKLSRQYPSLAYLLRYSLADAFGMTEENLALAENAVDDAVDQPEGKVGLPDALVEMLLKVMAWNAGFGRWKKAAHYAEALAGVTEEGKGVSINSLAHARYEVARARCCEELGEWRKALAIYERLGEIEVPVRLRYFEPVVLVRKAILRCRRHLGTAGPEEETPSDPLGAPAVKLPQKGLRPVRISSLAAAGGALWIGARPYWATPYREKRAPDGAVWAEVGGLYRHDLRTGALKRREFADEPAARWITALMARGRFLYVGTFGAGLFRLDLSGGASRRWTTEDGLVNDCVGCLGARDDRDVLIGFGRYRAGGCGWIDMPTEKYSGYSPRLATGKTEAPRWVALSVGSSRAPPKHVVTGIAADSEGTLWTAVYRKGLQRHDPGTGEWDTATPHMDFGGAPVERGKWCITDCHKHLTCLAAGEGFVAAGARDTRTCCGPFFQVGSVDIYYPATRTWRHVRRSEGLPDASVHSLAVREKTLWIGGKGYVAAYDLSSQKLRRVYTVPDGKAAEALCIDGRTLWVGAGDKVYRIDE